MAFFVSVDAWNTANFNLNAPYVVPPTTTIEATAANTSCVAGLTVSKVLPLATELPLIR